MYCSYILGRGRRKNQEFSPTIAASRKTSVGKFLLPLSAPLSALSGFAAQSFCAPAGPRLSQWISHELQFSGTLPMTTSPDQYSYCVAIGIIQRQSKIDKSAVSFSVPLRGRGLSEQRLRRPRA